MNIEFGTSNRGRPTLKYPKNSSYLPWQRCFFGLKPRWTYGLVKEPSSNVQTCFTNCIQFMLQLTVTTHPVYTRRKNQQLNARVQTLINSYDENKEKINPFLGSRAHLQWLIDTICYSNYHNWILCVFEIFF